MYHFYIFLSFFLIYYFHHVYFLYFTFFFKLHFPLSFLKLNLISSYCLSHQYKSSANKRTFQKQLNNIHNQVAHAFNDSATKIVHLLIINNRYPAYENKWRN